MGWRKRTSRPWSSSSASNSAIRLHIETLFSFRAEQIGRIGDRHIVMEDAAGNRIEAADRRKDYSNAANLVRAAAMLGRDHPAVLVRLFVQPVTNAIVALPLAALTPKHHLRLGL